MASDEPLQGVFPPCRTRHPVMHDRFTFVVKDLFSIRGFLLVGVLIGIWIRQLLLWLRPLEGRADHLAIWLTIGFALYFSYTTVAQSYWPSLNPFSRGVVYGKTSVQLPKPFYNPDVDSLFPPRPEQGVVVFLVGARFSHPLGVLAPGGYEIGQKFHACIDELAERAKDFGCLGSSMWRGAESARNNTIMSVIYFRDMECLHKFAHDKIHREAWQWFSDFAHKNGYKHIGVYHEAFYSRPGEFETTYNNMPPILLASTNVPVHNTATSEDGWVRPMVNSDVPAMRTMWHRMGKA